MQAIYFAPDTFVTDLIQGRVDSVGGMPVVAVCETPFTGMNGLIKRGGDLILSVLILILISPLMLLIALCIKLTSPGHKPVQTTRDLPGFWRGSWKDVQRDMKGRYPKHRWPDEPWSEAPSLKTKNAFLRT